jgi:proline dehydrogenase
MNPATALFDSLADHPDTGYHREMDAGRALLRIARDERIKAYVQEERPLHDALLGAALRYIASEDLETCVSIARRINATGHAVTIDFLGESTRTRDVAEEAATAFHAVIEAITANSLLGSVSLDLSHLGLLIDPGLAHQLATGLAVHAEDAGFDLMISAEGSERTDDVLASYERLAVRFSNVGITLQARLHRTAEDLSRVLELGRGGKIRIVKGAFDEPLSIALPRGRELNDAYVAFVERVVANRRPVSIATHDPMVLSWLADLVASHADQAEIEMLYGVQPERLTLLHERNLPTRVYLPYGYEWFLYLTHRLAEHPPNVYRAISDAVSGWRRETESVSG